MIKFHTTDSPPNDTIRVEATLEVVSCGDLHLDIDSTTVFIITRQGTGHLVRNLRETFIDRGLQLDLRGGGDPVIYLGKATI